MVYRQRLIDTYSGYYQDHVPRTKKGWNHVLARIELNFGEIFVSLPRDSLILDAGCGVGYLEHYLLEKGYSQIFAVDLSQEQIDAARESLANKGLSYRQRVTFEKQDAIEYLARGDKYDLIAMIDFLEHFPKEEVLDLLKLSRDSLREGGTLILRVINADNPNFGRAFYHDFTHETPFTADSIQQCLKLTGFTPHKIDYERNPLASRIPKNLAALKRFNYFLGQRAVARLMGISPHAFSEDLVAIARK